MKMLISVPHFTVTMEGSHDICYLLEWYLQAPDETRYLQLYSPRGAK